MATSNNSKPACKSLVLDAGPLLSLSPLRGLAETFYTVPQVLNELKDKRAREHFEKLGLSAGVRIQVQNPDPTSLGHVIQHAKKTGDYAVLSHADLCVLALTYALDKREKDAANTVAALKDESDSAARPSPSEIKTTSETEAAEEVQGNGDQQRAEECIITDGKVGTNDEVPEGDLAEEVPHEADQAEEEAQEPLDVELHPVHDEGDPNPAKDDSSELPREPPSTNIRPPPQQPDEPLFDDPSDEDDGEGEWITPSNVGIHKSRALHLVPEAGADPHGRKGGVVKQIGAGCMTADFAMQNVLLQMGLSLIGIEGRRIERVKTWVLRCHACFKICKDSSRKFCPSCGNPTLLRASVTLSSPTATDSTPTLQVHLKKNFQFKTRGTIYSIPAPKPGSAKTGPGEGLVLREDQTAWMRAKKLADGKRQREEKRMLSGAAAATGDSGGVAVGSWMDPDWLPEMLSVGTGGKGRSMKSPHMDGDMPVVGHGRKNPNERRRRK